MTEYVDILLTQNGVFCLAPPWMVNEGDFVYLRDALSGDNKLFTVVSVVTDQKDGAFIKMLESYTGYPLPRINAKFNKSEVEWDGPVYE